MFFILLKTSDVKFSCQCLDFLLLYFFSFPKIFNCLPMHAIPFLFVSFFLVKLLGSCNHFLHFLSSYCSFLNFEPPSYAFELKNSGIYWRKVRWWHLQTHNYAFILIWIWNRLQIRACEWHLLLQLAILLVNNMPQPNFHTETILLHISWIFSLALFNFPHVTWIKKNLLLLKVR